jgi:hypothetical protein
MGILNVSHLLPSTTAIENKEKTEAAQVILAEVAAIDPSLSEDEQIKEAFLRLSRKYAKNGECKYRKVRCLECGYAGEMPITDKAQTSASTVFAYSVVCFWFGIKTGRFFAAICFFFLFSSIIGLFRKVFVACPSCKKILGPISVLSEG